MHKPSEKSKAIRESVKEWLKSGDNRVPDVVENLLQGGVDPQRFKFVSRRFVERYEKLGLTLHFHIQETLSEFGKGFSRSDVANNAIVELDTDVSKYCAVAEFFVPEEHSKERVISVCRPLNVGVAGDSGDEIQRLVFIDVVDVREDTQRLIPTRVRLQSLDECNRSVGHSVKPMLGYGVFEVARTGADGEHIFSVRGVGRIGEDELPDNVIESRADVMAKIARDNTEHRVGLRKMNAKDAYIVVFLGDDFAIAYGETGEHLPYRFEMFLCPDQLEANAI